LEFLIAMTQFIIASTMAYWYFSNLNQNKVNSPVSKSFFRAIVYHSGSLAFGALVLCILWIIQIILEVFHWMVK
jgi:choline transporter-like protein 2/4/5